jgi:hypothetical protein
MEFVAFLKSRFGSVGRRGHARDGGASIRAWIMGRTTCTPANVGVQHVNGHLATVKIFFGFLIQRKVLAIDPSAALVFQKQPQVCQRIFRPKQEMEADPVPAGHRHLNGDERPRHFGTALFHGPSAGKKRPTWTSTTSTWPERTVAIATAKEAKAAPCRWEIAPLNS